MRRKSAAANVAYPAILSAVALVLVYLGSIAPRGNIGIVAAAGVLMAGAVVSVDLRAGFLSWAAVSVLSLLLVPDKSYPVMFAVLFGLYPMVKSLIEGRRLKKPLEYLLKLAFFNAALTILWLLLWLLVGPEAMGNAWWLAYPIGNVIFLLYDFGFSKLIAFYIARVDKNIR